jgi:hypothetical protein
MTVNVKGITEIRTEFKVRIHVVLYALEIHHWG